MNSNSVTLIIMIALGVYCIWRGVMTLVTGKLPAREEEHAKTYSEEGLKKYKLLSSVFSIIGGILVIVLDAVKLFLPQYSNILWWVILVILIILVIAYVLILKSCKNTK